MHHFSIIENLNDQGVTDMHRYIKILLVLVSMAVFWCLGESFLVQEKMERRKTPGQLKQEIAEVLADIVEQESAAIETKAQIQQVICKLIRSIAENDTTTTLKKAKVRDLQSLLRLIRQEKERSDKERALDKRFLATLRAEVTH